MDTELQNLINDARKELRKASGQLSPAEEGEETRKAAVTKLEGFVLRKLYVRIPLLLEYQTVWSDGGPVAIFKAKDRIFKLRRDGDTDNYPLFVVEGLQEREITRIEGADPLFASRFLAAIGDAS